MKKTLVGAASTISDVLFFPLTLLGAIWFKMTRKYGLEKLPITRSTLVNVGVFPIRDHYYEPQFKFSTDGPAENVARSLPGVDLNTEGQLALLSSFNYQSELMEFPVEPIGKKEFFYENRMFGPGDAEYLYSLVRSIKPKRIVEIGSGFSTLVVRKALKRNSDEVTGYVCKHICIEPYENPWLADIGVELIRKPLEDIETSEFAALRENDILFIDSSHMIRPGGDVLREFLEILPILNPGVFVHIHDIFTPFDYPDQWMRREVRFWNEQYLLEAFLTGNSQYSVVGALNYLSRNFPKEVSERFPVLAKDIQHRTPGSFWIKRCQ